VDTSLEVKCPCCSHPVFREVRECPSCGYFEHEKGFAAPLSRWVAGWDTVTEPLTTALLEVGILLAVFGLAFNEGHFLSTNPHEAMKIVAYIGGSALLNRIALAWMKDENRPIPAKDWTLPPVRLESTPGGQAMLPPPLPHGPYRVTEDADDGIED
jgi:hypothetical protein